MNDEKNGRRGSHVPRALPVRCYWPAALVVQVGEILGVPGNGKPDSRKPATSPGARQGASEQGSVPAATFFRAAPGCGGNREIVRKIRATVDLIVGLPLPIPAKQLEA